MQQEEDWRPMPRPNRPPADPRVVWKPPPRLAITYVNVRPLNGALIYTDEGTPIPADEWSQVPVSAGIIAAIRNGDLEEGERVEHTGEAA